MKNWKKILMAAGFLMALGFVLAAAAYFAGAKLNVVVGPGGVRIEDTGRNSRKAVRETVHFKKFNSVQANVDDASLRFIPSDHYGASVTYYSRLEKPSLSVEDGTLKIVQKSFASQQEWFQIDYDFFRGAEFQKAAVTVFYPKGVQLDFFHLTSQSGNAEASSFSADDIGITCKYGDLKLSDASCGGCSIRLDDGNGEFQRVTAKSLKFRNVYGSSVFRSFTVSGAEEAEIRADDGSVTADGFKANAAHILNKYGKVSLRSLNIKNLRAELEDGAFQAADCTWGRLQCMDSYGDVSLSDVTSGGADARCKDGSLSISGALKGSSKFHSDSGGVTVKTLLPKNQYRCECSTESGHVSIDGRTYPYGVSIPQDADNSLDVTSEDGNVSVSFGK